MSAAKWLVETDLGFLIQPSQLTLDQLKEEYSVPSGADASYGWRKVRTSKRGNDVYSFHYYYVVGNPDGHSCCVGYEYSTSLNEVVVRPSGMVVSYFLQEDFGEL